MPRALLPSCLYQCGYKGNGLSVRIEGIDGELRVTVTRKDGGVDQSGDKGFRTFNGTPSSDVSPRCHSAYCMVHASQTAVQTSHTRDVEKTL